MSIELDRASLRSELGELERLIADCAPEEGLARLSLESRRAEVERQLRELEVYKGRAARATLLFRGAPVLEARGIEADFGGLMLESFHKLVAKAAAARAGTAPGTSNPMPGERSARLFVTGIAAGSFGFTLEEAAELPLQGSTPLAEALDETGRLLAAAQDDELFSEAVAHTDPELIRALSRFLGVVVERGATLKVRAGEVEVALDDPRQLKAAYERTATVRQEADLPMECTFEGLLPVARRFELRRVDSGEVLSGRLSKELHDPHVLKPFISQRCIAHLRVITFQRPGQEHSRYELRSLTPPPSIP
jgi:hypothetical protein